MRALAGGGGETGERALTRRLREAEHVRQDRGRILRLCDHQRHTVKAADGGLGRDAVGGPGRLGLGALDAHKREAQAVGIAKRQHRLAKGLCRRVVHDARGDEAVRPPADRRRRHAKGGFRRFTDAEAARRDVLPRKESEDRAGAAGLVSVIKVISAGIIEVDGLLDQSQSEHARVEVKVARGRARNGRDVMEAGL